MFYGMYGVELFFALSGFLIGTILIRLFVQSEKRDFGKMVFHFWIRRWFRTLPNYYVVLILNFTLFAWLFKWHVSWDARYFFFLQNFLGPHPPVMPEAWSLAIEEWFYLSFPLIVIGFSLLRVPRKSALLAAILCYIVLFTGLRASLGNVSTMLNWDEHIRKVVMFRLDAIGYGVLAAYFSWFHPSTTMKLSRPLFAAGCVLLMISAILFLNPVLTNKSSFFLNTFFFSLNSLGFSLLIPWFKNRRCDNRLVSYAVTHVSIASYSMYLLHGSCLFFQQLIFPVRLIPCAINMALFMALTLVFSTLACKFFELPATRLRDRFSKDESTGRSL